MNHINVSLTVNHPVGETVARLESFLQAHAPNAEMQIKLRAPFDINGLKVGLTLDREVVARFAPLSESRRAYAIAWQPAADGPFPAFAGTIFVSDLDAKWDESIVTLDGHYHPPLGVAGDMFDALVGRHIAQASAADLLERITMHIDGAVVSESSGMSGRSRKPMRSARTRSKAHCSPQRVTGIR